MIIHKLGLHSTLIPFLNIDLNPTNSLIKTNTKVIVKKNVDKTIATTEVAIVSDIAAGPANPTQTIEKANAAII
jgi:hypothetical protein